MKPRVHTELAYRPKKAEDRIITITARPMPGNRPIQKLK
jgi:hypothetical protein